MFKPKTVMWILVGGLILFEIVNYVTNAVALRDWLGDNQFAIIMAVAFCAADFGGIARIFTPERGKKEPLGIWLLGIAWLLAATMNMMLTWYAVMATMTDQSLGNEIVSRDALLLYIPIGMAVMIWLVRITLIGGVATVGDNLFNFHIPTIKKPGKQSKPVFQATDEPKSITRPYVAMDKFNI